jgi:hypothetical protein
LHEKKEAKRTQEDYMSALVMSRLVSQQHMRSKRFAETITHDLCVPLEIDPVTSTIASLKNIFQLFGGHHQDAYKGQ